MYHQSSAKPNDPSGSESDRIRALLENLNNLRTKLKNFAVIDELGQPIGEIKDLILDSSHQLNLVIDQAEAPEQQASVLLNGRRIKKVSVQTQSVFVDITKADVRFLPEYFLPDDAITDIAEPPLFATETASPQATEDLAATSPAAIAESTAFTAVPLSELTEATNNGNVDAQAYAESLTAENLLLDTPEAEDDQVLTEESFALADTEANLPTTDDLQDWSQETDLSLLEETAYPDDLDLLELQESSDTSASPDTWEALTDVPNEARSLDEFGLFEPEAETLDLDTLPAETSDTLEELNLNEDLSIASAESFSDLDTPASDFNLESLDDLSFEPPSDDLANDFSELSLAPDTPTADFDELGGSFALPGEQSDLETFTSDRPSTSEAFSLEEEEELSFETPETTVDFSLDTSFGETFESNSSPEATTDLSVESEEVDEWGLTASDEQAFRESESWGEPDFSLESAEETTFGMEDLADLDFASTTPAAETDLSDLGFADEDETPPSEPDDLGFSLEDSDNPTDDMTGLGDFDFTPPETAIEPEADLSDLAFPEANEPTHDEISDFSLSLEATELSGLSQATETDEFDLSPDSKTTDTAELEGFDLDFTTSETTLNAEADLSELSFAEASEPSTEEADDLSFSLDTNPEAPADLEGLTDLDFSTAEPTAETDLSDLSFAESDEAIASEASETSDFSLSLDDSSEQLLELDDLAAVNFATGEVNETPEATEADLTNLELGEAPSFGDETLDFNLDEEAAETTELAGFGDEPEGNQFDLSLEAVDTPEVSDFTFALDETETTPSSDELMFSEDLEGLGETEAFGDETTFNESFLSEEDQFEPEAIAAELPSEPSDEVYPDTISSLSDLDFSGDDTDLGSTELDSEMAIADLRTEPEATNEWEIDLPDMADNLPEGIALEETTEDSLGGAADTLTEADLNLDLDLDQELMSTEADSFEPETTFSLTDEVETPPPLNLDDLELSAPSDSMANLLETEASVAPVGLGLESLPGQVYAVSDAGLATQPEAIAPTETETVDEIIPLLEERINVEYQRRKVGEVIIRKQIETRMVQVPVRYEKLIIEQVSPEHQALAEVDLSQGEPENIELLGAGGKPIVSGEFQSPRTATYVLDAIAKTLRHRCKSVRIEVELEDSRLQEAYQEWLDQCSRM